MTEDIVERAKRIVIRRETISHDAYGARKAIGLLAESSDALSECIATIESLRAQFADAREKVNPIEGDDLREAICNSIPYVNTNVVQAAIDGDFSNSPQWIWRNHENGVVGFGRWPDDPDAAPYIRADLICAALARMSTSHALGFKAGIEAAAGIIASGAPETSGPDYGMASEDERREMRNRRDERYRLADLISSLSTPPSPLPEILETMRPLVREAESYGAAENAGNPFPDALKVGNGNITVGHLRAIAAVFTKLGGNINAVD